MAGTHSKTILFIGDSLIEFFDWQRRFPEHKIFNLGIAGETVEGLLSRIDRIIKTHPAPDLIFIMTGINNVAIEDFDFLDSYKEIIKRLRDAYPKTQIFITSLLPTLLEWIPEEFILKANLFLAEIAKETGAEFLDIHACFANNELKECLLPDGVHLSDKGYALWSQALEKIIK
jgi:lysophospholipase L1-like esterase